MKYVELREKFLLEKMGIGFNTCTEKFLYTTRKGLMTEWEYFGNLFEWCNTQKWWGNFVHTKIGMESDVVGPLFWPINQQFIDPGMFATAVYLYLNPPKPKE